MATRGIPKSSLQYDKKSGRLPTSGTTNTTVTSSLDHRMKVENDIVDELLLVCGVIGTTTESENELVPVTDCLNWLQDLQRALRRDEDLYRPISILIGKWKVVEQKLLPLVLTCRYDTAIVLTIVKILVILTKPLAANTKRAGQMVIDVVSKKASKDVLQQQMKLRENALEQANMLMEYKRIICRHPSHQRGQQHGVLSVFVSLLAEPLSKTGASRTDADHLTIELVLHLFRNLLAAEPLLATSSEVTRESNELHKTLIALFEKEMVLQIILVLGQELERQENAQYNLLMMELLNHLFKYQDPTEVARSNKLKDETKTKTTSSTGKAAKAKKQTSSLLSRRLKEEQSQRRNIAGNRHGNFAGTWVQKTREGKHQYVGAAKDNTKVLSAVTARTRINKRNEPFRGSTCVRPAYSRCAPVFEGPATRDAHKALNGFCEKFVSNCYGPVMKSLKNEFRRDSARLEDDDKVIFFKIVWFLNQWWRMSAVKQRTSLGQMIFTMDIFSFSLVLNATDYFHQEKRYDRLTQAVALYSELLHMLHIMQTSTDSTENIMALGLMDRLFYNKEPLDRLPRLLSRWVPATMTREYACDLVEICHMSLKLLETQVVVFQKEEVAMDGDKDKKPSSRVEYMMTVAKNFDVQGYFLKKIVSNQLVWMYTQLLGYYEINSPLVHHRIIAMFMRISRTEIAAPEIKDENTPINPLGIRRTTLEPMLYLFPLIHILGKILNDPRISTDTSNTTLISFATNLLYKFWQATHENPLYYVECLFRHVLPHRYCEYATNLYVSEELQLLAERELLWQHGHHHDRDNYMDTNDMEDGTKTPECVEETSVVHTEEKGLMPSEEDIESTNSAKEVEDTNEEDLLEKSSSKSEKGKLEDVANSQPENQSVEDESKSACDPFMDGNVIEEKMMEGTISVKEVEDTNEEEDLLNNSRSSHSEIGKSEDTAKLQDESENIESESKKRGCETCTDGNTFEEKTKGTNSENEVEVTNEEGLLDKSSSHSENNNTEDAAKSQGESHIFESELKRGCETFTDENTTPKRQRLDYD